MKAAWQAGTEALAVPVLAGQGSGQIFGRACWVVGLALMEATNAAPASLLLYNQAGTTSPPLVPITLAANGSIQSGLGAFGVPFTGGVYGVITGSIQGAIVLIPAMT